MGSRQNGERMRVMIVEQDLDFGMKLADWLATHGYQPVFVRTVDAAIDELSSVRPRAIDPPPPPPACAGPSQTPP